MDIVSRLKLFLENRNIANSQFADTCGIPRPTLSQILNGRNKKISDELISKIHQAYPSLSILWLMFGEGVMDIDSSISSSESYTTHDAPLTKTCNTSGGGDEIIDLKDDLFSAIRGTELGRINTEGADCLSKKEKVNHITSIVVFYDDNTFQTFSPSQS